MASEIGNEALQEEQKQQQQQQQQEKQAEKQGQLQEADQKKSGGNNDQVPGDEQTGELKDRSLAATFTCTQELGNGSSTESKPKKHGDKKPQHRTQNAFPHKLKLSDCKYDPYKVRNKLLKLFGPDGYDLDVSELPSLPRY